MPTGQRLRARREALGLTLKEVATRLRQWYPTWDDTLIYKMEHGKRSIKADELPYIAIALECSPLDLLDKPNE